jgi:2'-5' RNA ligase
MDPGLTSSEKNRRPSYGLTLVAGMPFPPQVSTQAQALQEGIERQVPGVFTWYAPEHLHLTLAAPLRGRYRDGPPLRAAELPPQFPAFLAALQDRLRQQDPFPLSFCRADLAEHGSVLWRAEAGGDLWNDAPALIEKVPGFDRQNPAHTPHVTLGYVRRLDRPAAELLASVQAWLEREAEAKERLERRAVPDSAAAQATIDRLWLVHYANRTLDRVLGQVELPLGRPSDLSVSEMIAKLQFAKDGEE